ncbi:PRC-barrel domain-containing protein [Marivita sp.]|uniref:PRC-barrel domain-containing protein n=1 Tax=Marivita sp. TaxID=2003365 RepID=UPI0025B82F43|nr:PRC-barrel domain-containing protein [Marivita sp.]
MKKLLATTAIATMAAMPLYAENHTGGDSTSGEQQASMSDPSMTSGDLQIRGSELMGKTIYVPGEGSSADQIENEVADASDQWQDAGEVGDIILSREGELKSITMDVGGFLGVGEKVVSASMDELRFVTDSDDEGEYFIVFNGDRSELEDREAFDQAAAEQQGDQMMSDQSGTQTASSGQSGDSGQLTTTGDDMESADSSESTDTMQDNTDTASDTSSSDMTEDERTADMSEQDGSSTMSEEETAANTSGQDDQTAQQTQDTLSSFTADELEGMPVYGSEGDRVGEVERIILTNDGQVETVVVDVGGFLGLGEKPVAVALDDLLAGEDANSGEMRLSVNHTEEDLQNMESWEE